jgi:acetyl-CoA C-acetyltransferase
MNEGSTPILVGAGQYVSRETPTPANILSGVDIASEAARRALADANAQEDLKPHVDALAVMRFFEHSTRKVLMVNNPFGATNNVPGSVARRLALAPRHSIYCVVGGQSPQRTVNEMAERIHQGEVQCALLTGGEAIANLKHAVRNGLELDWSEEIEGEFEDRWPANNADAMVSEYEMNHGLFHPLQAYPICENAWRHQRGLSVVAHREVMGAVFSRFSEVAAANPYAQFPVARSAEFLATPSADNYLLSEPYTKWLVAQDAVNQGAAVLLTSVQKAREWGIPEERWVYLHGYADCDDVQVVERPDLAESFAQNCAIKHVLDSAECTIEDIAHLDIYSCFPIAVLSAAGALGIDPQGDRTLTLTGGLAFFGGPGNNYSMHAIAEVVARTRAKPGTRGLVIANGGYLSKHSAGVYSTTPVGDWRPIDSGPAKAEVAEHPRAPITERPSENGVVESYVAVYKRGEPSFGYIFGRQTGNHTRFIAQVKSEDSQTLHGLFEGEPIGRKVKVASEDAMNYFRFAAA